MTSLKPCPFCGGEATAHHYPFSYHICCENENCAVKPSFGKSHDNADERGFSELVKAWNTRAELGSGTCENVAREWEKTSFAHAGTSFCCSECGAHYVDAECYYAGLADKDEEQIRTSFCPNCGRQVLDAR